MKAEEIAVRYMISVWDEVMGNWRERPDHVAQKFLEAEKEMNDQKVREHIDSVLPDEECKWKEAREFGDIYYETSCGGDIVFTDGTPEENEYRFCPYCGKEIKIIEN